jgi:arylsulfatase A-like enzyme
MRARGTGLRAAALALGFAIAACGEGPVERAGGYDARGRWTGGPAPARPAEPWNLVLVVVDTLRADAVALGGAAGGSMPRLSALASEGVAFSQASAPASWTPPSIASLLTGLLPLDHGCDDLERPRLAADLVTYAEALSGTYGYDCTAFVDGPWFGGETALLQGFEVGGTHLGLTKVRIGLDRWRARREAGRPFCLLVHTFDAHDPYGPLRAPGEEPAEPLPPREALTDAEITRIYMTDAVRRRRLAETIGNAEMAQAVMRYTYDGLATDPREGLAEALRRAYLDGLGWVDGLLADLVSYLREHALLERTLLVVTSDHGEAFGEHGRLGHGRDLHDELLRVPLVLVGAGPLAEPGRVLDASVGLIDLFPTFFELNGLREPPGTRGRSLLPLLRGATREGRPVHAEETVDRRTAPVEVPLVLASVRDARWKWMLEWAADGGARETVHDLAADPLERLPLPPPAEGAWPLGDAFCAEVAEARRRAHARRLDLARAEGRAPPAPPPAGCAPPRAP